jgi:DNA-binding response OmpR family regulator
MCNVTTNRFANNVSPANFAVLRYRLRDRYLWCSSNLAAAVTGFSGRLDLTHNKRDLLIVDDDHGIRSLISLAMTRRQLLCDTAADGEDALRCMRDTRYAVVLLDLMMPRVDGAEFLRRLEEQHLTAMERPIILLMTAFTAEAVQVGGDAVQAIIRKPFDVHDLVGLVSGCVDVRRTHEATALNH